jgi:dephospho-CoA kinase
VSGPESQARIQPPTVKSPDSQRAGIIPLGESQLFRTRPGFLFVFLYRQFWWLAPVAALFIIHAIAARIWTPDPMPWLAYAAWLWLLLGLIWRTLTWLSRAYILTDQRIIVRAGIFRIIGADIPLRRIQHTTITRSLLEQVFNLGTIGITTAGADGAAINLLMVPNPNQVLSSLRDAAQRAPAPPKPAPPAKLPPPVIGLAGGIGSGKSEVAHILASLGCLVTDSDKEAKEALDRPEIRTQLAQWWGPDVLLPDGRINRKAIADIVFKSGKDRAALEALVHPLLRARRADLRARAQQAGARAAVIDAPLLFEAGVDTECDAVIFVYAPRALRLERIKSRGWDEAELSRREAAQLPLDQKQRRSTLTIVNDGTPETLRDQVAKALARLSAKRP